MLFLVFQLGKDRYAIEAATVIEILPIVTAKQIPQASAGIVGVVDYHGSPVPLIDLAELVLGQPSRRWMSTRIVLVNYPVAPGESRTLGLLAEHATETLRRNAEDFTDSGVTVGERPFLGPVTIDAAGVVQKIEIRNLLSQSVRDQLFRESILTK